MSKKKISRLVSCASNIFGSSLVTEVRGGSNSVVESQPSKLLVAGSIPVSRSRRAVMSGE